jgi:cyclopropane-fatty-acyl-phospholipid synthase
MPATWMMEHDLLPDAVLRWGIRRLLRDRLKQEALSTRRYTDPVAAFMAELRSSPVAIHTVDANAQHYEVPTDFFLRVLGPCRKYSSCLWEGSVRTLAESEIAMLDLTSQRAQLTDGQQILDLGCGWGSFSLYAAPRYPNARFTAVSNSRTQKTFIDAESARRGLTNLRVITCDINAFVPDQRFDRIVSVEMLEHVRNYDTLFARLRTWLEADGRLFVHVFCHDRFAYPFEVNGDKDWMARYFFTGGIMPSADLLPRFDRDLVCLEKWMVNGTHYAKTLEAWLVNMDAARDELMPLFRQTYGADQALKWWVYWRIFFLACAELFNYREGREWYVSHYLFAPRPD